MIAEATNIAGSTGSTANVTDGALQINPRSEFDQAVLDGRAFSWSSMTYDPDANDTILGVENNSTTHLLKIGRILVSSDTASMIQVFIGKGVTMTGTAVTGVNLNRSSGRTAEATAIRDETGNGAQAASYVGATYAQILQKQVAASTLVEVDLGAAAVVLPYDGMIGVDLTTAATAANITMIGWFEPI